MKDGSIVIAATFTAEPIQDSLAFWLEKSGNQAEICFAPYNQVFQQLLDPNSLFQKNTSGINIALLRFEDWYRYEKDPARYQEMVRKNLDEFGNALKTFLGFAPCVVCVCPPSPNALADANTQHFFEQIEETLGNITARENNLFLTKSQEIAAAYPVEKYYDAYGDKQGHIPYTTIFFTALGTLLARRIYALRSKPRKVIILDCDQTLWQGICGEDGPEGVSISRAYHDLQEFMLKQQANGRLLCLCSKNNERDVWEVFDKHPEMPLKREHLAAWRINWRPKSENLRSLADELNLGLDSFILVDDNPMECSEVRANCPGVEVLQLPENAQRIPAFLSHVWAFDQLKVTSEDQQRTLMYGQNKAREAVRQASSSFESFLAGLQLNVEISTLSADQTERVAQLTQRTNQFNLKTIRRSAQEILALHQSGALLCETVSAKDRFGDYGLIGAMFFSKKDNLLDVDTFILSCRALGRGIENRMLVHLTTWARQQNCDYVNFSYRASTKNQPIFDFLHKTGGHFEKQTQDGADFCLPVGFLLNPSQAIKN